MTPKRRPERWIAAALFVVLGGLALLLYTTDGFAHAIEWPLSADLFLAEEGTG